MIRDIELLYYFAVLIILKSCNFEQKRAAYLFHNPFPHPSPKNIRFSFRNVQEQKEGIESSSLKNIYVCVCVCVCT